MNPSGEWCECGSRFYHRLEVYARGIDDSPSGSDDVAGGSAAMPTPLDAYTIAAARFGGPVAMVRDTSQLLEVVAGSDTATTIFIGTASGRLVAKVRWDSDSGAGAPLVAARRRGRLVGFGWTSQVALLCIDDRGSVFRYDVHGKLLHAHYDALSLGDDEDEDEDEGAFGDDRLAVTECCVWDGGAVALAVSPSGLRRRLFSLRAPGDDGTGEGGGFMEVEELACPEPDAGPIHCLAVSEPLVSVSGQLEVILAVGRTLFVVDGAGAVDQGLDRGPFRLLSLCPNGQLIAAHTSAGSLLVMSADFQEFVTDFHCARPLDDSVDAAENSAEGDAPDQLAWCGVDSVVLRWEERVIMVGPYGDWVKFTYDEPVHVTTECDGVRITSETQIEFLYRVPDCMVDIYRPGSTAPAALLYDARRHFDEQTAKADENLRAVGDAMAAAIEGCIEAAGFTFDPPEQKRLLRAAGYGLVFCDGFARDRYREMCATIRVLNNVRSLAVGMPLTYLEYQALTPPVLVSRLANAHHHLLACKIAAYNNLAVENVLHHWAKTKILTGDGVGDQALCDAIVSKLRTHRGTSFASVASYAYERSRKRLAALLLEFEMRASKQVPLLLEIGEMQRAIDKAIESGDADLVYYTLFYVKQRISLQEFLALVNHRPQASNLFISYCKKTESDALKTVLQSMGRDEGIANATLAELLETCHPSACVTDQRKFVQLVNGLDRLSDLYNHTKEHAFESRACSEYGKLLRLQRKLQDASSHTRFLGLSVTESIAKCLLLGNTKAVNQLKSDFKMTDKQVWYVKIRTLCAAQEWRALQDLAQEKRSPVGYGPFVETAKKFGAPQSVLATLIAKVSDPKAR